MVYIAVNVTFEPDVLTVRELADEVGKREDFIRKHIVDHMLDISWILRNSRLNQQGTQVVVKNHKYRWFIEYWSLCEEMGGARKAKWKIGTLKEYYNKRAREEKRYRKKQTRI